MFIAMPIIANISPCRLHVNIFQENVVFLHEMHSANQMADAAKDPDEQHKQEIQFGFLFYFFKTAFYIQKFIFRFCGFMFDRCLYVFAFIAFLNWKNLEKGKQC